MAETIVSDKKNRSVSKGETRKNTREKNLRFNTTVTLLIVYLIDQLSYFLYALLSVNQSI